MKPVFRCEYCNFIEVEEKVKEHELTCMDNYTKRSCYTCAHKTFKSIKQFGCACGKEIPEGCVFEYCDKYERKEKRDYDISDIFGSMFGGR